MSYIHTYIVAYLFLSISLPPPSGHLRSETQRHVNGVVSKHTTYSVY